MIKHLDGEPSSLSVLSAGVIGGAQSRVRLWQHVESGMLEKKASCLDSFNFEESYVRIKSNLPER
jgi:hypothetical protein